MKTLSSLRKRIRKLELCQDFLDRTPEFDAYEEIKVLALFHLSVEEIDHLLALHSLKRQLNPMGEVSADQKAAITSLHNAVQQECQRFGITVEQYNERRGLTRPLVLALKQQQMERNRSRPAFKNRHKRKMGRLF
jgi:hypothetical protein